MNILNRTKKLPNLAVYKSYEDFKANPKSINGCSAEWLADKSLTLEQADKYLENCKGCWNCYSCIHCEYCIECSHCSHCKICSNCESCDFAKKCESCEMCEFISYSQGCKDCNNIAYHIKYKNNQPQHKT